MTTDYRRMSSAEYTAWWKARQETAVTVAEPAPVQRMGPPLGAATVDGKAMTGVGATYLTYSPHLSTFARTPQARSYMASKLYWDNSWIRLCENPVSQRAAMTPWHLEDESEEEIEDSPVLDLLRRPQDALPEPLRQPGLDTWRGLTGITLRHMGLAGSAFWYLDSVNTDDGTPLAILYIAPWRLYPDLDQAGRMQGLYLDRPKDDGGLPLDRRNLLPFYLTPPDMGMFATGFVEAFGAKAGLEGLIDRHIASVLAAGGRLTGLISPKAGSTVTDDQWQQFVRDYRNITADPSAAQRLQIVQGPVDFVRTAATMDELAVVEVDERTRDNALALWGVPRSQAAIAQPAGLNSGGTKESDVRILWEGAISPRLDTLRSVIQTGLIDRYNLSQTLVIEEPSFDDEGPAYDLAVKAVALPLKVSERRELIGKEPFGPDIKDDRGRVIDDLVFLPSLQAEAFYANRNPPPPEPEPTVMLPGAVPQQVPVVRPPVKALIGEQKFLALRRTVDNDAVPKLTERVASVLRSQKAQVAAYLRKVGLEHIRRKRDFHWNQRDADRLLGAALEPEAKRITARVTQKAHAVLAPGKATVDEFTQAVLERVLAQGADRVTGINRTTRDRIAEAIAEALEDASTIDDVIAAVESLDIFGPDRAEVIARTESMFAYNAASLGSFAEFGVAQVQAIDGDGDPECAERDGQVFSLSEAELIQDHPNGTLDWIPVLPDEAPQKADIVPGGLLLVRDPSTHKIVQIAPNAPVKASVRLVRGDDGKLTGIDGDKGTVAFERDEHGRIAALLVEQPA